MEHAVAQGAEPADDGGLIMKTRRMHIRPRGATSVSTCETIRSHDLCFGIGPAGTGKTYLAVASAVAALEAGARATHRAGAPGGGGGRAARFPAR